LAYATLLTDCSGCNRAIVIGPTCLYSKSLKPSPRAPARNKSSTAQHMLRQLVSPGKRPITFVRRFTSSNERSNKFEDRNRVRSRGEVVQMDAQRGQVLGQAGRCARIWPRQFGDQFP